MWELCHKLFGWDYAYVQNSMGAFIARVTNTPNGYKAIRPYGRIMAETIIISKPLPISGEKIGMWLVKPLTPNITMEQTNEHA